MFSRPAVALLALIAFARPVAADETGSFVVRLGVDTTAIERYTRTAKRVEIDQVGRSPRVLQRHFVFDLGPGGVVTRAAATVTAPGAASGAPAVQQIDATVTGDSVFVTSRRDTAVQLIRLALPKGALLLSNTSPWAMYEGQTIKLAAQKGDSLRAAMYQIGNPRVSFLTVRRLGRDSVVIQTENDRYHARVDGTGRIQSVVPISGTQKVSVDRVANLDVAATASAFAGREKQGGPMGALSTRDTVQATAGGAALWVDYSRPAKRGRVIFGGVVPWDQLWRTGANMATTFRSDKGLEIGGIKVPAGYYSLWTIPSPNGWKLVINGETGQTGTEHKAERDLYTIPMSVTVLSEPVERFTISVTPGEKGGTLNLDWDTTRASVPFTVTP